MPVEQIADKSIVAYGSARHQQDSRLAIDDVDRLTPFVVIIAQLPNRRLRSGAHEELQRAGIGRMTLELDLHGNTVFQQQGVTCFHQGRLHVNAFRFDQQFDGRRLLCQALSLHEGRNLVGIAHMDVSRSLQLDQLQIDGPFRTAHANGYEPDLLSPSDRVGSLWLDSGVGAAIGDHHNARQIAPTDLSNQIEQRFAQTRLQPAWPDQFIPVR